MADRGSWREVVQAPYWYEEDAREVIAAWRRSGRTRAQFCEAHGIAVARLTRWERRLDGATVPQFHPVRVAENVGRVGETLVVELPGVATIRLPPGFVLEDLQRILRAFESEAC